MKHLTLTAAALALVLGAGPLTSARADDATPDEAPAAAEGETTEPETIQWIEGWEAGKAAAAESGQLMLVYVHRTSPP